MCRNNLKQIALAVLQYEVAHKTLPPAGTGYGWCQVWKEGDKQFLSDPHIVNQSGLSLLLGYLGQESLDAQLDRTKSFSLAASPYGTNWPTWPTIQDPNGSNPIQNGSSFAPADLDLVNNGNLALMSTQLAIFHCPSDPGDPVIPADGGPQSPLTSPYTPVYGPGGNYTGAKTNYDFVVFVGEGDLEACNSWGRYLPPSPYMFGQNSFCPIARVTDGMSNTFMLAETVFTTNHGGCPAWGYRSWGMGGIDPIAAGWINNFYGVYGTLPGAGAPASMHPGGCHFAIGDGSVRWVNQNVGNHTLYHMSMISDGNFADTE